MLQGKLEKPAILGTILLPSWDCFVFHLLIFYFFFFGEDVCVRMEYLAYKSYLLAPAIASIISHVKSLKA